MMGHSGGRSARNRVNGDRRNTIRERELVEPVMPVDGYLDRNPDADDWPGRVRWTGWVLLAFIPVLLVAIGGLWGVAAMMLATLVGVLVALGLVALEISSTE